MGVEGAAVYLATTIRSFVHWAKFLYVGPTQKPQVLQLDLTNSFKLMLGFANDAPICIHHHENDTTWSSCPFYKSAPFHAIYIHALIGAYYVERNLPF